MPFTVKLSTQKDKCADINSIIRLYSEWAETYDQDLKDWTYVAPEKNVSIFRDYILDRNMPILDIGCGTGLVGNLLRDEGYKQIDGLDICAGMLTKAAMTGAYNDLLLRDLMEAQTLPKAYYGAIISVGIFTTQHVGPMGLENVLRMLRKGGVACITIKADAYTEEGYQAKLEQLVEKDTCSIIEETQEPYMIGRNVQSRIIVLRKN